MQFRTSVYVFPLEIRKIGPSPGPRQNPKRRLESVFALCSPECKITNSFTEFVSEITIHLKWWVVENQFNPALGHRTVISRELDNPIDVPTSGTQNSAFGAESAWKVWLRHDQSNFVGAPSKRVLSLSVPRAWRLPRTEGHWDVCGPSLPLPGTTRPLHAPTMP